jgi:molecular chaperone DnaK (HSP70)
VRYSVEDERITEAQLTNKVTEAVATVSADSTTSSIRQPKDAGVIAGLTLLPVINEPPETITVFALNEANESEHNFLIFDFGAVPSMSRCSISPEGCSMCGRPWVTL